MENAIAVNSAWPDLIGNQVCGGMDNESSKSKN